MLCYGHILAQSRMDLRLETFSFFLFRNLTLLSAVSSNLSQKQVWIGHLISLQSCILICCKTLFAFRCTSAPVQCLYRAQWSLICYLYARNLDTCIHVACPS